jgi:hypothetical protein
MMDKLRRPSMHLRAQMSVGCCALYSMRAPSASGEVNLREEHRMVRGGRQNVRDDGGEGGGGDGGLGGGLGGGGAYRALCLLLWDSRKSMRG